MLPAIQERPGRIREGGIEPPALTDISRIPSPLGYSRSTALRRFPHYLSCCFCTILSFAGQTPNYRSWTRTRNTGVKFLYVAITLTGIIARAVIYIKKGGSLKRNHGYRTGVSIKCYRHTSMYRMLFTNSRGNIA